MNLDARLASDRKAVEELHRRDIAAAKAYDVETLVSLWTADIVALAPSAAPIVGKQAGRAMLEAGREASRSFETLEHTQDWRELQIVGDYAFEWGTFEVAARPKGGGKIAREKYKVLRVLQRQADGSWKVHRTMWNNLP